MIKQRFTRRIITYELIGFGLILIFSWASEMVDIIMHGGKGYDVIEILIQSLLIILPGWGVIYLTRQMLNQIKHLEGYVRICAYCKKVGIDGDQWVPIEEFIKLHSEAEFSHGFCPTCMREHYPEFIKSDTA